MEVLALNFAATPHATHPQAPRLSHVLGAADLSRNSMGMRFVEIPAGSFDMGSTVGPGEGPVHRVSVRSFWKARSPR